MGDTSSAGCPHALTLGRDGNGRPIYHRCTAGADHDGQQHTTVVTAWSIDGRGLPAARVAVEVTW